MKRIISLVLLLTLLLCGCGNEPAEGGDSEGFGQSGITDFSQAVSSSDPQESSQEPEKPLVLDLSNYYPAELSDLYILFAICGERTVIDYDEDVFRKIDTEIRNRLPAIYQFIKPLKVEKDAFIRENEYWKEINRQFSAEQSVYTDLQIELMFNPEATDEEIMQALKNDGVYYYKGRLYTIFDLFGEENLLLTEMTHEGKLGEYLEDLKAKAARTENYGYLVAQIEEFEKALGIN